MKITAETIDYNIVEEIKNLTFFTGTELTDFDHGYIEGMIALRDRLQEVLRA